MIRDIVIRGVTYPTVRAVAKAFGVNPNYVRQALREGRGEYIGTAPNRAGGFHEAENPPLTVRIRGVVYPSPEEAAKALGVKTATIHTALLKGREDFVGLGRSRKHRKRPTKKQATAKPVRIGAHSWPSIKDCARDLRVGRATLCAHIKAGDTAWLMAKAMKWKAREESALMEKDKTWKRLAA